MVSRTKQEIQQAMLFISNIVIVEKKNTYFELTRES